MLIKVRSGNVHIIRLLLEKHADINAKYFLKLLKTKGLFPAINLKFSFRDSEGRTPLHIAIDRKYTLSKYKAQEEGNGLKRLFSIDSIMIKCNNFRPNGEALYGYNCRAARKEA